MGRKGNFAEKPKKGPGRKAKKQSDPQLTILANTIKLKEVAKNKKQALDKIVNAGPDKKLSSNQKKRAKKRLEKLTAKKSGIRQPNFKKPQKKKETSDGEDEDDDIYNSDDSEEIEEEEKIAEENDEESDDDEEPAKGFTDDNKEWLTPKSKKKLSGMGSDDDDDEDEEIPDDDFEGGSDSDDSDDDSEDEGDNDDGMLPIEKKSKKLAQKLKKEAEDSEKEMKLNLAEKEIFTLPSGQDIEKESNQPPDLQILQDRIREVIK